MCFDYNDSRSGETCILFVRHKRIKPIVLFFLSAESQSTYFSQDMTWAWKDVGVNKGEDGPLFLVMIVCLWFMLSDAQPYYFKGLCQCQILSNIVHSGLPVFWVGTSCVHCQHIPVSTVINNIDSIVLFFATLFWHENDVNSNNNNKFTLVWINITKLTTSFLKTYSL